MNRAGRIISIALGIACLAMAAAVQRKPAPVRQVASPSANILLADPVPNEDDELLARPVSHLDFTNAPLDKVLAALTEMDSAPIDIGSDRFDVPRVPPSTAVTIHINDGCLADAILAIVQDLATRGYPEISFGVWKRRVHIGSGDTYRSIRSEYFNVRPLLDQLGRDDSRDTTNRRATATANLTELFSNRIDPDSWRDRGGMIGSMRELGGILIITQTPENMAVVRLLLDALSRAGSASGFSPRMAGATLAVFNVRPLIRPLEASSLEVPATDRIRAYIKSHVEYAARNVVGGGDIFFLGGNMVVEWQANIPLVQQALEQMSRELAANGKREKTP